MTDERRLCPTCGLALGPDDSKRGCPNCLLRMALTAEEETDLEDRRVKAAVSLPPGLRTRFFGDYEILGELARGGMGVIYKARQLSLNRLVALKMIQASHLFSSEARLRFRMEVEAVAQLNHPQIVPLYESGEHDGTHYFTMRLVEGGTLAETIAAKGRREGEGEKTGTGERKDIRQPKPMAALLEKIARAVHYAHQRGILHRDLKPSNILLDAQGEPHVADFGLAKMLAHDDGFTFTESILGSPNYMAPEQASGRAAQITVAADVYGLGAILYELLTGEPPFKAATPIETIRKVCDEEPLPPRRLKPGLDADLETICLKCLQKDPALRYHTAEELADDLDRWSNGLPIRARPVGPFGSAWRWGRRHPAVALLCAALGVALIAIAIGSTLAAWRIRSANQRAEDLVTRMQIQKAEDLFSEGESSRAMAVLAHVLHKDSRNLAAALRLQSALQNRRFALPIFPPMGQGSPLALVSELTNNQELITLTMSGAARTWNLRTKGERRLLFDEKRPVTAAAMSANGKQMLIGFRDRPVQLRDGPGFGSARELASEKQGITAAVFSPSGRLAAAAFGGWNVRIWDTLTGGVMVTSCRHPLLVRDLQFSSDEQHLVTACADGQLRFWAVSDAGESPTKTIRQSSCVLLRFDTSGRWMAVGQHDGGLKVWDLHDISRAKWGFRHAARINDLAFSADADLLLTASDDDTAQVWNLSTGSPLGLPLRHGNRVNTARFSPDDRQVVTASGDNTARIWETATGKPLTEELPHKSGLNFAVFSSGGQHVVTTAYSGVFALWELREPFIPTATVAHHSPVTRVQFSPDGTRVASGSLDGEIRITDAQSGDLLQKLQHDKSVNPVAFSPDGRWLAAAGESGDVRLIDPTTRDLAFPPLKHDRAIRQIEFTRNGARLLARAWDQVHLWDMSNGQRIGAPLQHDQIVNSARFSPDGRRVITTADDRTVRLWSAIDGKPFGEPIPVESGASYAEFSPDNDRIVLALRGHIAVVISVESKSLVSPEMRHRGGLLHATFSHDGSRIVTAAEDQTAKVWALHASDPLLHSLPHRARVVRAEFSPDDRMILTLSSDGTAKLWDATSGLLIADPIQHPGVGFACFSPDGRRVAVCARDGTVLIRPVPEWTGIEAHRLADLAEQVARQRFTPPDRFDAMPGNGGNSISPSRISGGVTNSKGSLQDWLGGADSNY